MARKVLAFLRRDFQTQISYRADFLMRLVGMILNVSSFYFVSRILDPMVSPYLQPYSKDYFHFALLGLAFYGFTGSDSLSGAVQSYQQSGTLEVLFLSSTPILGSLVMSTLWGYLWALVESLAYLAAGTVIFGAQLEWASLLRVILVVLMLILANAGFGLVNAGFALVSKRGSPLSRLLRLATGLLAGMYYPIDVLPTWLQFLSRFLPASYCFRALRSTLLQGASVADIASDLLALAAFAVVLLPAGLMAFRYAVRRAKMDGSLSQY